MMTLNDAIKAILDSFNTGDCFDSHTVINALRQNPNYYLAYLQGISDKMDVLQYHGHIGILIDNSGLAKKIGTAKSHTIFGNLAENALWQKN